VLHESAAKTTQSHCLIVKVCATLCNIINLKLNQTLCLFALIK